MEQSFSLGWLDYTIMLVYFVFVLGIGWALKRHMKSATAFLEAGRSLPAWITGLAFISANLGALEVIGMAASGAKYGMMTVHFYWIGAIPGISGTLHDALLLWFKSPVSTGVFEVTV